MIYASTKQNHKCIPLDSMQIMYQLTENDYLSILINDWNERLEELKNLTEKYSEYCDKSVQNTLRDSIDTLCSYIQELPNKFSLSLSQEHQKIISQIVNLSRDCEHITKIKETIQKYNAYDVYMSRYINKLENALSAYATINAKYSQIKTYKDYFDLDVLPNNIGSKLDSACKVKQLLDDLENRIEHYFSYDQMAKYYESVAELYACDYFAKNGYNLKNATVGNNGGVDLKIIDKNNGDNNYFYVEVTCIATYLGEDMENILNASGADFLPTTDIAEKLRKPILPQPENSKKKNKAAQISKFIADNNLSEEDRVFLWIDLSRIVRTTKIKYDWLSPKPYDALVNVFYNQQQSYIYDTNNSSSGNVQLSRKDNHNVFNRLNGIIFYSDTDGKTKYLHSPHFKVNNPVQDFPKCDFYYFEYKGMFYCICYDDLIKKFT